MSSGSAYLLLLLLVAITAVRTNNTALCDLDGNKTESLVMDDLVQAESTVVEEEVIEDDTADGQQQQQQQQESQESKRDQTIINRTESGFMPSFQLGSIATFPGSSSIDSSSPVLPSKSPFNVGPQLAPFAGGSRTNSPFNSLSAIKFDNGQDDIVEPKQQKQSQQQQQQPFRPSEKDTNFVKFEDDKSDQRQSNNKNEKIVDENHRQGAEQSGEQIAQQIFAEQHKPVVAYTDDNYDNLQPQYATYDIKPSKFQDTTGYGIPYQHSVLQSYTAQAENPYQSYQLGQLDPFHTDDKLIKPETVINVHPISYQASTYETHTKPKTVVYVTSHETTRTRKYPYQYNYQQQHYEHTENPVVLQPEHEQHQHEEPYQYPLYYEHQHQKSISPWKKILHIIGAFLPLGLLLALLSPRVINAGQNTNADSNIVLSKLRVMDLPAEHKNNRLVLDTEDRDECEERSICRLVAAADPTSANFLRHLLQHITERTPESAVRKKELDRIFEAAKLGNCDILTCDFYDGT